MAVLQFEAVAFAGLRCVAGDCRSSVVPRVFPYVNPTDFRSRVEPRVLVYCEPRKWSRRLPNDSGTPCIGICEPQMKTSAFFGVFIWEYTGVLGASGISGFISAQVAGSRIWRCVVVYGCCFGLFCRYFVEK